MIYPFAHAQKTEHPWSWVQASCSPPQPSKQLHSSGQVAMVVVIAEGVVVVSADNKNVQWRHW